MRRSPSVRRAVLGRISINSLRMSTVPPVINGNTYALDASSWNTNRIAGPSPSAGLFFNGTNATAANGGLPVGLYTPVAWEEGSSVTHLDDENPLLQPLMMAAGARFWSRSPESDDLRAWGTEGPWLHAESRGDYCHRVRWIDDRVRKWYHG